LTSETLFQRLREFYEGLERVDVPKSNTRAGNPVALRTCVLGKATLLRISADDPKQKLQGTSKIKRL
jgi:hypothetical protein